MIFLQHRPMLTKVPSDFVHLGRGVWCHRHIKWLINSKEKKWTLGTALYLLVSTGSDTSFLPECWRQHRPEEPILRGYFPRVPGHVFLSTIYPSDSFSIDNLQYLPSTSHGTIPELSNCTSGWAVIHRKSRRLMLLITICSTRCRPWQEVRHVMVLTTRQDSDLSEDLCGYLYVAPGPIVMLFAESENIFPYLLFESH